MNSYLFRSGIYNDGYLSSVKVGVTSQEVRSSIIMPETYKSRSILEWIISAEDQLVILLSLGPKLIDQIYKHRGSSLKMWLSLKETCGIFDEKLIGFRSHNNSFLVHYGEDKCSFIDENRNPNKSRNTCMLSRLSYQAIMVCKRLQEYYQDDDYIFGFLEDDIMSLESNLEEFKVRGSILESNVKGWNPYFRIHNPVKSLNATCWSILYEHNFNPYEVF